jgi:hypothetical protein
MVDLSINSRDRALALLGTCAEKGERCPPTSGPDADPWLRQAHIGALAKLGYIRVEVSTKNWRQVFILRGPHAGKATAPNPLPYARVYSVQDKNGLVVNGKVVDRAWPGRKQKISLPVIDF